MNYTAKTVWLIAFATIIRCIVACTVELGNDEVYYRIFASDLQWNYFDHPPMVAWLIRFTTGNLLLDNEFFIRLGAILSSALATWLMFKCGKRLGNAYTGFLAACIYSVCIYSSVIAGIFILPDSPQMICWTAGLYLLICIADSKTITARKNTKLILFGVIAGIGMLCKIHTVFLWLGFLLYIILYNRKWLLKPALYVSGLITILIFYPVIKWNIDNDFITFFYHSSRVNIAGTGIDPLNFISFVAGQFFYVNPVIFICIIIAVIAALKNNLPLGIPQKRLLLLTGLPLISVALAISFFKPVLPHWTGPAYSSLILLTACYFTKRRKHNSRQVRMIPYPVFAAGVLLLVILGTGIFFVNFFPGSTGVKDAMHRGDGDFTLDMYGWIGLKDHFTKIVEDDKRTGLMKPNAVMLCNKWFPAAHLDYYIAMPMKKDLLVIGDVIDIHQYAWLNTTRKQLQAGDDAYCIVPSNYFVDVKAIYTTYFATILPPEVIEQKRNGTDCRNFYIWKLKNCIRLPDMQNR